MVRGSAPGRKPSITPPRRLGKFYDIEKDSPFWLVWKQVENYSLCHGCPDAWNCPNYEGKVNRRMVYCPKSKKGGENKP